MPIVWAIALQRTMRIAQQLYEGIEVAGQGSVGLITYMRTDSTHLSSEAIDMARSYIDSQWGQSYLPDKPNVYTSSNKSAQEAHEAIRPTDVRLAPRDVKSSLSEDQFKLYNLIWQRFLACQMTPAQWDSTSVMVGKHAAQGRLQGHGAHAGLRRVLQGNRHSQQRGLSPLARVT